MYIYIHTYTYTYIYIYLHIYIYIYIYMCVYIYREICLYAATDAPHVGRRQRRRCQVTRAALRSLIGSHVCCMWRLNTQTHIDIIECVYAEQRSECIHIGMHMYV